MEASEEQSPQHNDLKDIFDKIEKYLNDPAFETDTARTSLTQLLLQGPDAVLSEENIKSLIRYSILRDILRDSREDVQKIIRGAIALQCLPKFARFYMGDLRSAIRDGSPSIHIYDIARSDEMEMHWQHLAVILQSAIKLTSLHLTWPWNALNESPQISRMDFLKQISTLPHLTSVILDYGNLSQLNEVNWETFYRTFTATHQLKSLSLANCGLNQLNTDCQNSLLKTFLGIPGLTSLNIPENNLGELKDFWKPFFDTLLALDQLNSLNLAKNRLDLLSPLHLATLYETLQKMPNLSSLDLSENQLAELLYDEHRMKAFCHTLENLPHLTSLYLNENKLINLDSTNFKTLCQTLGNMKLSSLSLENNSLFELDSEDFKLFCQTLENMSHLTSLNLSRQPVGGLDLTNLGIFCETLQKMKHLTSLNLGKVGRFLHKSILEPLCEAVLTLPHLTSLTWDLDENYWTSFVILLNSNFQLLDIQIVTVSNPLAPEKKYFIEHIQQRNQTIHGAEIAARTLLTSLDTSDTLLEEENAQKTLDQLNVAITHLKDIQTPEAKAHRKSLEVLHDKLANRVGVWFAAKGDVHRALHFYQETAFETKDYSAARLNAFPIVIRSHRDDEKATRLEAFLAALPLCLDPKNRLISFDKENSRDFDAALLEAALDAIGQPNADVLSDIDHVAKDDNRLKLLRFVTLMDLKTKLQKDAQTSSQQTDLFKVKKYPVISLLESKLSSATSLDEILKLPIDKVWEEIDLNLQKTLSQLKEATDSFPNEKREYKK